MRQYQYQEQFPRRKPSAEPIRRVILCEVSAADYYTAGVVEGLEAKVDKLTAILSVVVSLLPPDAQDEVASSLGWKPVEGGDK